MPTFLAEFYLPRGHATSAAALAERVERAAEPARPVRFVRAVSVPAQEFCLCVFDAADSGAVEVAARAAGLVLTARPEHAELIEALERLDRRAGGGAGAANTRPREESR